jgi:hypothetical protein
VVSGECCVAQDRTAADGSTAAPARPDPSFRQEQEGLKVSEPRTVYAWAKNSRDEVRATLSKFHGHLLADIRVWTSDDEGDADHPTRKGISVRVEDLPKLLSAVEALLEATSGHERRAA